jgi:hypothetical protein
MEHPCGSPSHSSFIRRPRTPSALCRRCPSAPLQLRGDIGEVPPADVAGRCPPRLTLGILVGVVGGGRRGGLHEQPQGPRAASGASSEAAAAAAVERGVPGAGSGAREAERLQRWCSYAGLEERRQRCGEVEGGRSGATSVEGDDEVEVR